MYAQILTIPRKIQKNLELITITADNLIIERRKSVIQTQNLCVNLILKLSLLSDTNNATRDLAIWKISQNKMLWIKI